MRWRYLLFFLFFVQYAVASCDRSPVEFSGQEFPNALKYFIGDDGAFVSNDVTIDKVVFTFGSPRTVPDKEHQVVDVYVQMDFDTQKVVDNWFNQVNAQADEGCSSRKVWYPDPAWLVDNGAWVGRFHIKQVTRKCYWFFGDQQTTISTNEVDFWNRVAVSVSPDGRKLNPVATNGESDNTPDFIKVIAQGLGAITQIVTLGFVPQANVQAIDGHQGIESALIQMQQIESGMFQPANSPGPKEKGGFQLDFLFKTAGFRKDGSRPILWVSSMQNQNNLPNEGEACTIRESLAEMKTGGDNVGPNGTTYVTKVGDSLWKIAERFYGNGKYHMLVAAANNIAFANMNTVSVGKKLTLDSVSHLRARKDFAIVMKHDSLWTLATRRHSGPYNGLVKANVDWLVDRNRIYPLQLVRVPSNTK